MPFENLFGEEILSKEELEKQKKQQEAEAKKAKAEEDRIAKEKKQFEEFRTSEAKLLENVIKYIDDVDENAINTDIALIQQATTNEEINSIRSKYSDLIVAAGKKKEEADKAERESKKASEEAKKNPKYMYPFVLHYAGKNIDTDNMFEHGKEYTAEQIRTKMLQHQYYEFSGKVSFEYLYWWCRKNNRRRFSIYS